MNVSKWWTYVIEQRLQRSLIVPSDERLQVMNICHRATFTEVFDCSEWWTSPSDEHMYAWEKIFFLNITHSWTSHSVLFLSTITVKGSVGYEYSWENIFPLVFYYWFKIRRHTSERLRNIIKALNYTIICIWSIKVGHWLGMLGGIDESWFSNVKSWPYPGLCNHCWICSFLLIS